MSCGGCAKVVTGALKKVEGVADVKTDLEKQKVFVTGTAASDVMLAAIQKTGKKVSLVA
jgi:copper chaperone CopZ